MGVGGAGDCEREGVVVALFCGGPRAQADFDGSWGGFFDVDTVADLLILWRGCQQGVVALRKRRCVEGEKRVEGWVIRCSARERKVQGPIGALSADGGGHEKASQFADKDPVTWKGEMSIRTNVDEYRLRDLSFCECGVGLVRAWVVFSKNDLPAGELTRE
jgi:hypothetical protein